MLRFYRLLFSFSFILISSFSFSDANAGKRPGEDIESSSESDKSPDQLQAKQFRIDPSLKLSYPQDLPALQKRAAEGDHQAQKQIIDLVYEDVLSWEESFSSRNIAWLSTWQASEYFPARVIKFICDIKNNVLNDAERTRFITDLSVRANGGEPQIYNKLGLLHWEGWSGQDADLIKAMECFRKAIAQGYLPAQNNLGIMHIKGWPGQNPDLKEAADSFRKAAVQGYAPAQSNLGTIYTKGWPGQNPDLKEAADWLRKAAVQGNAHAQFELGEMYKQGWPGQNPDLKEAADWLRKAAVQGNALAQNNLGAMYLQGWPGQDVDRKKAAEWYRRAAVQGNALAQINLGELYEDGWPGQDADLKEAADWFRKAAVQGNALAQLKLGEMYTKGWPGQNPDLKEAADWVRKAAEQGNPLAQFKLGTMYRVGWPGQAANPDLAFKWWHKSAKEIEPARVLLKGYCQPIAAHSAASEIIDPEKLTDFFNAITLILQPIERDMHIAFLRHASEGMVIDGNGAFFRSASLSQVYNDTVQYGMRISEVGNQVLRNIETPGFMINCLEPKEILRSYYKNNPQIEREGWYQVDLNGVQYYCFGGNNPQIGHALKHLFEQEKDSACNALKSITEKLVFAQDFVNGMSHLNADHRASYLNQINNELQIVQQARVAIDQSLDLLKQWVPMNVGGRNQRFKEENPWLF